MSKNTESNQELSRWQKLSGLGGEDEAKLEGEQRDAAIRTLLAEVTRLAEIEFARGGKVPEGERTVFWDPLESVCRQLGISRTKLSAYSRELTGLRAHELTDRIKARGLKDVMLAYLQRLMASSLAVMRSAIDSEKARDMKFRARFVQVALKELKDGRKGSARARYAATLGFPNASRLSRACLLAHGKSVDEMEEHLVFFIVQKFFEELAQGGSAAPANPPASGTQPPKTSPPLDEKRSAAEELIQEITQGVVKDNFAA